jgi:hypothetical protein
LTEKERRAAEKNVLARAARGESFGPVPYRNVPASGKRAVETPPSANPLGKR